MGPGARIRQGSPVNFNAGLLHPIAPNPQRMGRKTERCGKLRRATCRSSSLLSHACSGTCEAQSDRCLYARCSDCAEASWAVSATGSSTAVPALFGAFSADLPNACADPPRSADCAPTASNLSLKERVSGSSAPRQERFHTKPQHGSTRMGCWPLPRNDEPPSEILHCSREAEMEREQNIRKTCKSRTLTCARSGRQDKAGFPASGTLFLSVCLHIVLGRFPTFNRAQRAALFPIVILFQYFESRRPRHAAKSETAASSPAHAFLRCITRTAFLALRDNVRLPIVV